MVTPVATPKRNTSVVIGASESHPSGMMSKSSGEMALGNPCHRVQNPLPLGSETPPGSSLPPDAANVTSCHCVPCQNTSGSWNTAVAARWSFHGISSPSGCQDVHIALAVIRRVRPVDVSRSTRVSDEAKRHKR